jgi:hypothetical protein
LASPLEAGAAETRQHGAPGDLAVASRAWSRHRLPLPVSPVGAIHDHATKRRFIALKRLSGANVISPSGGGGWQCSAGVSEGDFSRVPARRPPLEARYGVGQMPGRFAVDLDRRQSSRAIGRGSMLTPAHHEASSPKPWRSR